MNSPLPPLRRHTRYLSTGRSILHRSLFAAPCDSWRVSRAFPQHSQAAHAGGGGGSLALTDPWLLYQAWDCGAPGSMHLLDKWSGHRMGQDCTLLPGWCRDTVDHHPSPAATPVESDSESHPHSSYHTNQTVSPRQRCEGQLTQCTTRTAPIPP